MPEGDTIFRAATALRKALQGARVTQFRSARLGRGPVGERIEEVTARGKNLLLRFEKGRTLRTHMMMHGSWHIYREGVPLERALLTQSALSGVGNVIKCEALFLERRDPFQPVSSLDDEALA